MKKFKEYIIAEGFSVDQIKKDQIVSKLIANNQLGDFIDFLARYGINGEKVWDILDKAKLGKQNSQAAIAHILKILDTPQGLKRLSSTRGY